MKSIDYVKKYQVEINEAADLKSLYSIVGQLLIEFIDESIAVGTKRAGGNKPNDRIMLPVIKEFNLKWRAIANHIEALDPDGYINFFRDKGVNI